MFPMCILKVMGYPTKRECPRSCTSVFRVAFVQTVRMEASIHVDLHARMHCCAPHDRQMSYWDLSAMPRDCIAPLTVSAFAAARYASVFAIRIACALAFRTLVAFFFARFKRFRIPASHSVKWSVDLNTVGVIERLMNMFSLPFLTKLVSAKKASSSVSCPDRYTSLSVRLIAV